MTREVALTAVYQPVEKGWVQARVKELPEVITAAPTREEAKELLLDALWEYLLSLRSDPEIRLEEAASADEETLEISLSA